ncbi:MAG: endonuclease V [Pirellulales bacterium]
MFLTASQIPDLESALVALLGQVPEGKATTHGRLAAALGDRIAARWVGHWVLHHRHTPGCPCHRVVRVDGSCAAYIAGSSDDKLARLAAEGVQITGGRVDLERSGFEAFRSKRPLVELRSIQQAMVEQYSQQPPTHRLETVAGLDISYVNPRRAVAAYVLLDRGSREVIWTTTLTGEVRFPYVTTYLAFRELPLLWALWEKATESGFAADAYLVDGSGILHQRHAGIATCFGVTSDVPTVGVTKKLLCGRLDEDRLPAGQWCYVREGAQATGAALWPTDKSRKPIYASPGHRMSVDLAAQLTQEMMHGHKLPKPLYWADRLSRQEARRRSGAMAE